MPVREDGRWESWADRTAREKQATADEADEPATVEEAPAPVQKPRRQRRSKAAAEAAIAEATGATVDLDIDTSELEETPE